MTMAAQLPVYIEAEQIAQVAGISTWRARSYLRAGGIAKKLGRKVVVTRHDLRSWNQDIYDAVIDRLFPEATGEAGGAAAARQPGPRRA
jgi:hypothetical protein